MNERTLLIISAGGHGKAVAEAALLSGDWQRIVFADDRWPELEEWAGWPVVANATDISSLWETVAIAAIGNNRLRALCSGNRLRAASPGFGHSSACLCQWGAVIGAGVMVMAYAMVGTGTRLGKAAIVNATVDHDASLGDFSHLQSVGGWSAYWCLPDCRSVVARVMVAREVLVPGSVPVS